MIKWGKIQYFLPINHFAPTFNHFAPTFNQFAPANNQFAPTLPASLPPVLYWDSVPKIYTLRSVMYSFSDDVTLYEI